MIPLLIEPEALDWIVLFLGIGSMAGLSWLLYLILLKPALKAKAERDASPLYEGYKYNLVIDDADRKQEISVGQLDSTLKTRLNGIHEDQLVLRIVKDRGMEEYEVSVIPGSDLFYRRPHSKKLERLEDSDDFFARELIGYPALFRLAASVNKDNRPLQYVDLELSTEYIINNLGEEKMRFTLSLLKIYPGLDENSRNKKGIFNFGRPVKADD